MLKFNINKVCTMAAIASFIPFVLLVFHNQLFDLYYKADSDEFTIYTVPKNEYEAKTLYAEAETKLFLANDSTESYMYMEEVQIFLYSNKSRKYLMVEEETGVIRVTTNKSDAGFFTLKTTPELHESGQFQIDYATSNWAENGTFAEELVMKYDLSSSQLTQNGPFQLLALNEERNYVLHFKIRGKGTTLPELQS